MHNSVLPDVRKGTVSMGVYIKNWLLADWKELLKWAKIGANNAMIGEFTEVEEIQPHGRLVDMGEIEERIDSCCDDIDCSKTMCNECAVQIVMNKVFDAPTIIPASDKDTDVPIKDGGET